MSDAFHGIIRKHGAKGLYSGNVSNCLQVGPEIALTYIAYEFLKDQYFNKNVDCLTLQQSMICGSLSGLFAMSAVYDDG